MKCTDEDAARGDYPVTACSAQSFYGKSSFGRTRFSAGYYRQYSSALGWAWVCGRKGRKEKKGGNRLGVGVGVGCGCGCGCGYTQQPYLWCSWESC